jgi:hypothetical protein
LNVWLEPAEDFGRRQQLSLSNPTPPGDDSLVIEGVSPGTYWVRVQSSRGYPASIRSGNLDLEHQPLLVGVGGGTSPIEITMRDDTAEISGKVEGLNTPPVSGNATVGPAASYPVAGPHIYFLPLADSSGQMREIPVNQDGSFGALELPPGAYRLLAFDRPQPELQYRNPEAIRAYDSKGPVVRVVGGQKEHVTLQLISTNGSASE